MTGYTYQSGVATMVSTLRCPVCLVQRPVTIAMLRNTTLLRELCCPKHVKVYQDRVYRLEKTAHNLRGVKRLSSRRANRIRNYGVLSTVAQRYLLSTER